MNKRLITIVVCLCIIIFSQVAYAQQQQPELAKIQIPDKCYSDWEEKITTPRLVLGTPTAENRGNKRSERVTLNDNVPPIALFEAKVRGNQLLFSYDNDAPETVVIEGVVKGVKIEEKTITFAIKPLNDKCKSIKEQLVKAREVYDKRPHHWR